MAKHPRIITEAEFRDADAKRQQEAYNQRQKDIAAVQDWLAKKSKKNADTVEKSEKKKAKATEQGQRRISTAIRKLRWQMVTLLFFVRKLEQAFTNAWNNMAESSERAAERGGIRALAKSYEVDVGTVAATLRELSDSTISVAESLQIAQSGMLQDQGQFVNQYDELWQAARVAAVTSGADAQEVFEGFVQSLVEGTGEAADAAAPIFQLQLALQEYADAAGTTVEALDPMVAAEVMLGEIQETTNTLMAEGAAEALAQAKGFRRVKASAANLSDVAGVMGKEFLELSGFLSATNEVLNTMAQVLINVAGGFTFLAVSARRSLAQQLAGAALGQTALGQVWAERLAPDQSPIEAMREAMRTGVEAYGMFSDEVDEGTYTYKRLRETPKRSYDALIDHLMKRQDIMEKHRRTLEELERKRTDRIEDLEIKHQQKLASIERQAQRDRRKARRDYDRKVIRETEDYQLARQQRLENHLRDMRHAREKYFTQSLQDQRLYEYERGLLVAYGDVLAIEDLDARYALEQQAREENFRESQRQDQEEFNDTQRQKREQFELDLQQIERAYQDRLLEIREAEEERILEAQIRRAEEMRQIERDYERQLEGEEYRHQQSLQQWNQYWAKLAERVGIGAEEVTAILERFFGPSGEADAIITSFFGRWDERVSARRNLVDILGPESAGGESVSYWTRGRYEPSAGSGAFPGRSSRGYQFGGAFTASRPMMIPVGEGYSPERVSITPLGGNAHLQVSWVGDAIPVRGAGLEGADVSGLGDAVAAGLVTALQGQLLEQRR